MADSPVTSHAYTVEQVFTGQLYGLDHYQREYSWTRDDVRALLNDLQDKFLTAWRPEHDRDETSEYRSYFLGPYVYYDERNVLYLVDGQQRFTTLHLLLVHLRRLLLEREEHDEDATDREHLDILIFTPRHGDRLFAIDIEERTGALQALYATPRESTPAYELPETPTPSVRNLWNRARDLEHDFPEGLAGEALPAFLDWLLHRVYLVGIQARNQSHGWEIFESMNSRGNRLSPLDLLKSFLLFHAPDDREALNKAWRTMLSDLTAVDQNAPTDFVKALLVGQHADLANESQDTEKISLAFHEWVHEHQDQLDVKTAEGVRGFVGRLAALAKRYRTLVTVSRRPEPDLEPVFYNARNSLSVQLPLILSTLTPGEKDEEFKRKAWLAAAFLDLVYARQVVNNESSRPAVIEEYVRSVIPRLRACSDDQEVAEVLGDEVAGLPHDFSGVETFGMRPDNQQQVRYLLARLTAHVEKGCGRQPRIERYLDERPADKQPYEVEHLWVDRPGGYKVSAKDFQSHRNRFGALVLVRGPDDRGHRDAPYERRLEYYRHQEFLVAALHPRTRAEDLAFKAFLKKEQLGSKFRSFPEFVSPGSTENRQKLYRELCERVWDPVALGFVLPDASEADTRLVARPALRSRDLAKLLAVGLLSPGARLVGVSRGESYEASVEPDGLIKATTGDLFPSVTEASNWACNPRSCSRPWEFWQADTPQGSRSLAALRTEARKAGLL